MDLKIFQRRCASIQFVLHSHRFRTEKVKEGRIRTHITFLDQNDDPPNHAKFHISTGESRGQETIEQGNQVNIYWFPVTA